MNKRRKEDFYLILQPKTIGEHEGEEDAHILFEIVIGGIHTRPDDFGPSPAPTTGCRNRRLRGMCGASASCGPPEPIGRRHPRLRLLPVPRSPLPFAHRFCRRASVALWAESSHPFHLSSNKVRPPHIIPPRTTHAITRHFPPPHQPDNGPIWSLSDIYPLFTTKQLFKFLMLKIKEDKER